MSRHQANRLPDGGFIDRSRAIKFRFNGTEYQGHPGDTLASALLANGVRALGRSFKYHRPRGLYSAGEEEPNGILSVRVGAREVPSSRAPLVPLQPGLAARSQNGFPTVGFDLGRILDFTRALWPAGFYHKTFKWPAWRWYEAAVRRMTGLARLPEGPDPCIWHHVNRHCDVLICGAGPAGLAAALAAGRAGARVILAEQDPAAGGTLLSNPMPIDGHPAAVWIATVLEELGTMCNVELMLSTTVSGHYGCNVLTAVDRTAAWDLREPVIRFVKIRTKSLVITSGAIEQPLVFDGNDRPGVMLSGAVREYVFRYALVPGKAVAVAANNDEAWRTAFAVHDCGRAVPAIVDVRAVAGAAALAGAGARGIPVLLNAVITATRGMRGLSRIRVVAKAPNDPARRERWIECDALAVSGGWSPTVHLWSQAGGTLRYDEGLACFVPGDRRKDVRIAGAANGEFDLARVLAAGFSAGRGAALETGHSRPAGRVPETLRDPLAYAAPGPRISPLGRRSRQWIDLRHDVTAADVELAARENFVSVEHMKRYTTVGMAIDQGKTANLNALTLLSQLTGRQVAAVGTTTFRPPYTPVPLGAIAGSSTGDLYRPWKRLPAHEWHEEQHAVFEEYGNWKRPAWYARGNESREEAIAREVLDARRAAGIFDGSPLGKIEVRGPDAAEFLERIYVNTVSTLRTGRVRYGLMLAENGAILDDGVIARLGDQHFLVHTTAANADRVAGWLDEWHQCEWPQLRVAMLQVTAQWAVLTVSGPSARDLLSRLQGDIDFSAEAFPHMHVRSGVLEGSDVRVQSVSFSGESSFELSVPADRAGHFFRRIATTGRDYGLVPVGAEALLVLRLEKGYLHVGVDTDGTTNPLDVGFAHVVKKKQGNFVGRRSLSIRSQLLPIRRQLVGLELVRGSAAFRAGAHVVRRTGGVGRSQGFVTSAAMSPTLGRPIALAMIEGGFERKGEIVALFDQGAWSRARIVKPPFFDPSGERLHGRSP